MCDVVERILFVLFINTLPVSSQNNMASSLDCTEKMDVVVDIKIL